MTAEKKLQEKVTYIKSLWVFTLICLISISNIAFGVEIDNSYRVELYDASGSIVNTTTSSYVFDTKEKRPSVKLFDSSNNEIAPSNYTVSYYNNYLASKQYYPTTTLTEYATVIIKGNEANGYTGETRTEFLINNGNYDNLHVEISGTKVYDGKISYPKVVNSYIIAQDGEKVDWWMNNKVLDGSPITNPYSKEPFMGPTKLNGEANENYNQPAANIATGNLYLVNWYLVSLWDTNFEKKTTPIHSDVYNIDRTPTNGYTYADYVYVTKKEVTPVWDSINTFEYDGLTHCRSVTIPTGVEGESFVIDLDATTSGYGKIDAGNSYPVQAKAISITNTVSSDATRLSIYQSLIDPSIPPEEGLFYNYTIDSSYGSIGFDSTDMYTLTTNNTFSITPRPITLKANDNQKYFGEKDPDLTASTTPVTGTYVNNEIAKIKNLTRVAGENVNKTTGYAINFVDSDVDSVGENGFKKGNYNITLQPGVFKIYPLSVEENPTPDPDHPNPSVTPKSKVEIGTVDAVDYTGAPHSPKPTVTLVKENGDRVPLTENVDFTYSYPTDRTNTDASTTAPVVTIVAVPGGNLKDDRDVHFVINPIPLTVTPSSHTVTKGDPIPTLTQTTTGQVTGETPAFDGAPTTTYTPSSDVNSTGYPVTKGTLEPKENGNFKPSNYTITYGEGKIIVNAPATPVVTITAENKAKYYGEPDPTLTYTTTPANAFGTKTPGGALERTAGEDVTEAGYPINRGTLATEANTTTGFDPNDYAITYVAGVLRILPTSVAEDPVPPPTPDPEHPEQKVRVIVDPIPDEIYTGEPHYPTPTVTLVDENGDPIRPLVPGVDFDYVYPTDPGPNTDASDTDPVVIIKGKGPNFTDERPVPFKIKPKPIAYKWTGKKFVYDSHPHVSKATIETGVPGETIKFTVNGEQTNVGDNYPATVPASSESVQGGRGKIENYIISNREFAFSITPVDLDQAVPSGDVTPNPGTPPDGQPGVDGEKPDGTDNDVIIVIEIELKDDEFPYTGTPHEPDVAKVIEKIYTPSGELIREVELPKDEFPVTYKDNVNVGDPDDDNPPTAIVTGDGKNVINDTSVPFTITPAPLEVKADDKSITKGNNIPELTYKVTGAVNNEVPKFDGKPTTEATKDSATGTYPITVTEENMKPKAEGTFDPENYVITYVDGKLRITTSSSGGNPVPEDVDPGPGTEENDEKIAAVQLRNGSKSSNKANENIYRLEEEVIYYCDYMNKTGTPIKNVKMVLDLPLTYKVASSEGGKVDYKAGTITWNIGTLKSNETGTKKVVLKYTAFKNAATNDAKAFIEGDNYAMIYPYLTLVEVVDKEDNLLDDSSVINEIIADDEVEIHTKHIRYMWGDEEKPTFRPADGISRGEGAMVLLRIFEEDYSNVVVKGDEYTDLDAIYAEAQRAIVKCSELGIINGYPDGSYKPRAKMTRAEFMKIIASYIEVMGKRNGIKGLNAENAKNVTIYSATKGWSNPYVTLLARLNMVPISSKNKDLKVNDQITRAEVAQLCNYYLFRAPVLDDGNIDLGFDDVNSNTYLFGDIAEATRPSHDSAWLNERAYEIYKK